MPRSSRWARRHPSRRPSVGGRCRPAAWRPRDAARVEPAGGSKTALIRRCSSTTCRVDRAGRGRPLGVDDADADLGHEPAGPEPGPARQGRQLRRAQRPAVRAGERGRTGRRPPGRRAPPGPRRRRGGRRAAPTSSCRPTGPPPAGRAARPGRTGRPSPASQRSAGGRGRVRSTTSAMSPSVPSEPTSSRHRSKPVTFFTVGPPAFTTVPSADTYADLEQRVAHRSPAQPAEPAVADGQHAAHRGARPTPAAPRSGRPRPGRRRARPPWCPARTRTVISAGSTRHDARRAPAPRGPSGPTRPPDVPLRPAADGDHRPGVGRADLGGEGVDRTGRSPGLIPTRPRGRSAGRRTGCPPAGPWWGWPRRRGRTRRAAGPGRRGRRGRTAAA